MDLFWVGGTGNWDDSAHWSLTSGGSGGVGTPGTTDNAIFNGQSFPSTGQTVTIRSGHTNNCKNLDMSLTGNNPTLALGASATLVTYGNVTIPSGITVTRGASALWNLNGTGLMTWIVGADLSAVSLRPISTGTLSLGADLTIGQINNTGFAYTFNLNGHTLNISDWREAAASTINCSSSIIQLSILTGAFVGGELVINNAGPPNVTWNAGTSTIRSFIPGTSAGWISNTGTRTFYNIEAKSGSSPTGVGGGINTNAQITINNLTIDAGVTFVVTGTQTLKVNGTITSNGTIISHAVIRSANAGTRFTLNSPTNTVNVFFVDVKDCNATGITPFTTQGGTDNGNNLNWTFVAIPTVSADPTTGTLSSTGGNGMIIAPFASTNGINPTFANDSSALNLINPVPGSPFSIIPTGLIPGVTYTYGAYTLDGSGNYVYFTYGTFTLTAAIVKKRYYYKVYNTSLQYITTWSNDVVSDPTFRQVINGGAGELIIKLGRAYSNFGEGSDVILNNRVELWCMDCDAPQGVKIYTGYISMYAPYIEGQTQYVEITVLGYSTQLTSHILQDKATGDTTITYSNFDPSAILKDAIDKYHDDGGQNVFYSNTSVQNTNASATYPFINVAIREVLDKVIALSPDNWYWYIDPNGIINFKAANIAYPDHKVTIGKDISGLQSQRRMESIINAIYLTGGGIPSLFNYYERAASISQWGKFATRINDATVVDNPTADLIAKHQLDYYQQPEYRTVFKILDNNGTDQLKGANIEAFSPGDTIQVINLTSAPILIIQSITYYPDHLEVEASSRLPEVPKEIQALSTSFITLAQENLPPLPAVRSV